MPRPPGVLLWLCCWLCSAGALGWAAAEADPIGDAAATVITTPWEIRRQAQELMHDLSAQRAETAILLDRTQRLLRDHGEALIAFGDGWTPLSNAFASHLRQVGLQEEFRRRFEPVAARELDHLIDRAADWRQLLRLAREFPGTKAAQRAWRLVIDHAWDRGHLGTYLTFAEAAGEAADPQRRQRIAIARQLLQPRRDRALPETLAGLGEMWAITGLPAITREETAVDRHPFQEDYEEDQDRPLARYRFSTDTSQGLVAACDGQRLVLFDPLIGHRVGEVIDIGGGASHRAMRPIWADDRVIAIGFGTGGAPQPIAVDRRGEILWRQRAAALAGAQAFAQPVVVDDQVIITYIEFDDGFAALQAVALAIADGSLRWNRLIAKGQSLRARRWSGARADDGPDAVAHEGGLMVCSNTGLLAHVGSDGSVQRLWSYPTRPARVDRFSRSRPETAQRQSGLVSDGSRVLITPRDNDHLLVLEGDRRLRLYEGLGSGDQLVDAHDGHALLVGKRQTLVDLERLEPLWSERSGLPPEQASGLIGAETVLTVLDQHLYLRHRADGSTRSAKGLRENASMVIAEGTLITAGTDEHSPAEEQIIKGWGDRSGWDRLQEQVAARPDDFRPLLSLANLEQARGNPGPAFELMLRALRLGAPPVHAAEAARLARRQLTASLDGEAFAAELERFASLGAYDPHIAGEVAWWRGRQAELQGQADTAAQAYEAVLAAPTALIRAPDLMRADLHALAEAGLARLGRRPPPDWMQPRDQRSMRRIDLHQRTNSAKAEGFLSPPLITDELRIGFRAGHLTAYDRATGELRWRKARSELDSAMLGVMWDRMSKLPNLPRVKPIPGTTAMGMGIEAGDVLTGINDQVLKDFTTLQQVVTGLDIGDPITITVQRDGRPVTCRGTLGNWLMRPIAVIGDVVIAQGVDISEDPGSDSWDIGPAARNPRLEAIDLADGSVIWSRRLDSVPDEVAIRRPRIFDERILVLADGDGLTAFDIAARKPEPIWTRHGLSDPELRLEPIGPRLATVSEHDHSGLGILDLETGDWLFRLPADGGSEPLLADGRCFLQENGNLTCWQLDIAKWLWSADLGSMEPVHVAGDHLFVTDQGQRLRLLDARSGRQLHDFDRWIKVSDPLATADRLLVLGQRPAGPQAIAAINVHSGRLAWERPLPAHLDLYRDLHVTEAGTVGVLNHILENFSVLVVDDQGAIRCARQLGPDERVVFNGGQALIEGPAGGSLLAGLPPTEEAVAPVPDLRPAQDQAEELVALAEAALARPNWIERRGAAACHARSPAGRLLVIIRPAPGVDTRWHIGDIGPVLDHTGQWIHCPVAGPPAFEAGRGDWTLEQMSQLPDAEGRPLVVALLNPPVARQPGTGVQCFVEVRDGEDTTPWWYRPAWTSLDWREAPMPTP